jgi:uncharacterized membrane protein YdbT with pleckstrin-like domain
MDLKKDENLLMKTTIKGPILNGILVAIILIVFGLSFTASFFYYLAGFIILYSILYKVRTKYVLTDKRIIKQTGVLSTKTQSVLLKDITDINKENKMGFVSLKIRTSGGKLNMKNISKGKKFYNLLEENTSFE